MTLARRRHALSPTARSLRARLIAGSALTVAAALAGAAQAQQAGEVVSPVVVTAERQVQAYQPPVTAPIGPLGNQLVRDTPQSVNEVPGDLILNLQSKSVNETLRYLPSVQVRDQQGFEVSRPQSRGFQGSVVQNTRIDGLNAVGTTAMPGENLAAVEVLNGLAGAFYGPQTPAGVFNYILKRPTDKPTLQFTEGFDSNSVFTEHLDAGGRTGQFGYRLNLVRSDGESFTSISNEARTLATLSGDYHFAAHTVLEADYSYYRSTITGLPGSIVYDGIASKSGTSSFLPSAIDPTKPGYGQPDAGADLISSTGLIKLKHAFNANWSFQAGVLYEDAKRNLYGITNTLTDDVGDYTVTKNFTAVPHYTILSNTIYLNGHVDLMGLKNDVTLGTNGFTNGQYNYKNSIAVTLGSSNLANPAILASKPQPATGGQYEAGKLTEQSAIIGDTLHFNDQWSVQGVLNISYFNSTSWSNKGLVTSSDSESSVLSPTVSLIYKPMTAVTTYFTYANSDEQGETAPANAKNANVILSPYHDTEYEGGIKWAVSDRLMVTVSGFRMSRPYATTSATTSLFGVVGTQRNTGAEIFAQGSVTPELSVFGGVTYVDARLVDTGLATTNDKLVVGVPQVKSDIAIDYHPAAFRGFAFTGALHAESKRAATNTNSSFAPAYTTFDLGARYTFAAMSRPLTLRFQVLNVGDVRYYSSIADGTIVGSPGANTAYSGWPRVYQASLEVSF